jgi:DNA-3-methyladenine glycosylase II
VTADQAEQPAGKPDQSAQASAKAGAKVKTKKVGPEEAARILAERDPVIAGLFDEFGLPTFHLPRDGNFPALVRSVTYQQLAGAAARAIHGRLVASLGEVTPERMMALTTEELRAAGLSARKAESLRDLAGKVLDGTIELDSRRLSRQSDEDIVARLSTVKGIGKWSAEMFLMFQLRRLDVWPTGDLGVRRGYGLAWGIPMPTPKQLDALGEPYHPYRTVVAWFCWRAAERAAGTGPSAVTA